MDQIKTGKLITEMRKERGLTQKQLADELGISDRTVSKWECGKGMPDLDMIDPLCKSLRISINEFISGERISVNNYSDYAEVNMMDLLKQAKEPKPNTTVSIIRGVTMLLLVSAILVFLVMNADPVNGSSFLDVMIIAFMLPVVFCILLGAGLVKDFGRAVKMILLGRRAASDEMINRSIEAVVLTERGLIYSGIFVAVFYIILLLHMLDDLASIGSYLSVACLGILYGFGGALLLLPIRSKLSTIAGK